MSEPLKSVHVRLNPQAHRVLSALADMEEKDNAELARLLLEEVLLGRVHTLMVVASRYKRLGLSGISGDLAGSTEKGE